MAEFLRFREYCDHEGEHWNFWLQLDGNEAELEKLRAELEADDSEPEAYSLGTEHVPESEVDVLVRHSGSGYMQNENKVVGKFVMPEVPESEYPGEGLNDLFYKGHIREHFKES